MALLQISEPGLSAAPHQHKHSAGIDLGTTNSLVATVRSGEANTIPDHAGRDILPSVVHYSAADITVGYDAKAQATSDVKNTLISMKRFVGRSVADIQASWPNLPYDLTAQGNTVAVKTAAGEINPVQSGAEILKTLANRAEEAVGGELNGVVITVPAYFDDAQRQATKEAALLANLNVLRLINEPTAAAIAYGLDSGQEGVIAVYDLGGGTFDISILRLNKGVFEVLATGGDSALGGDDFDHLLADYLVKEAGVSEVTSQQQGIALAIARQVKEQLTEVDSLNVDVSALNGAAPVAMTREIFEQLIGDLVKKTLRACRRSLKDAGVEKAEVLEVVMVGGSTRVPLVREQVKAFFEREPLVSVDPDKVVALGAAIQADILVGNKPDSDMLLLDVTPLSLGIETMGGLVEKVIPRNTTIPAARAQEFTTFKDGQTAMSVHIVQGERELVEDCRSLARFNLTGIPPMAAGAAHIQVMFQVDADGLLSVSATEKSTGISASIQVKPSYGLQDDQIASMIKSSMSNAKEDIALRMLREQQVEADRVVEAIEAALHVDGTELLAEAEFAQISQAIDDLKTSRQGEDVDAIKEAIERLDKVTQDFAARRMDHSIRAALSGQNVDQL